ncbi:MAG: preprotein translocase subunit SecE [Rhodothermales bacterium]|nr:preprotein translocase subunit SecE [Rhodothermales bacterium]
MGKVVAYLQDVMKEMKKVSWPTRRELINNTIITVLSSFALAMFIYGADWVISNALEIIYG